MSVHPESFAEKSIDDEVEETVELLAKDIYEFGQNRWGEGPWNIVSGKERSSIIRFAQRLLHQARQLERRIITDELEDFIATFRRNNVKG